MSDSFQTLAALFYTLLGMTLLAACGYGLHRLAKWLEARGWLFYTRRRPRVSVWHGISAAIDPRVRHLIEVLQQEHTEEDESGDEPPAFTRALRSPFLRRLPAADHVPRDRTRPARTQWI